ncbi:transcriptional regulator, TetR family [Burkholderia sp. GAS332]|nr:transcriptional regulator, TetR family [Burkholderia sp. GAS332]
MDNAAHRPTAKSDPETTPDDLLAPKRKSTRSIAGESQSASVEDGSADTRPPTGRGRTTIARVLAVATELFISEGYGALTMRKVAQGVGLSLSNVQHYFRTREDLLEALIQDVVAQYSVRYAHIRNDKNLSPEVRLEKITRLLIEDDKQRRTQSLFINIWALAQTHEFARRIVEEMYFFQRQVFRELIAAVNPGLTPTELSCRAALITSQLDGLLVLLPQRNSFPSDIRGIEDEAVRAVKALALAATHKEVDRRKTAPEARPAAK